MISINVINRDKSIWGEDAAEFKLILLLTFVIIVIGRLMFLFS